MRLRRVYRIVFLKELRELLRDRRALLWLFAPPIVLPLIGLCGFAFVGLQSVKIAREGFPILVENGDQAPGLVQRFADSESFYLAPAPPPHDPFGDAILIVSLPQDFATQLERAYTAQVELITRDNSATTLLGQTAAQMILEDYNDELLDERLAAHDLDRQWLRPIQVHIGKRAGSSAVAGNQSGSGGLMSTLFLPLVITSWMLGGGIGLIVDTTVGEKERQTIENLLVTPASRAGIVMGKMSVIFIASLAVLGLWLTEGLLVNALGAAAPALAELESPGPGQIITVLLQSSEDVVGLVLALLALVVPFTVLLNSLVIAWCAYAANYREANLFMVLLQLALPSSVLLTVFSLPARVGLHVYAIPFFGSIVAIRDLFASTLSPQGLAVNLVSGMIYAALSIALAAWVFDQEWSLTRGI